MVAGGEAAIELLDDTSAGEFVDVHEPASIR